MILKLCNFSDRNSSKIWLPYSRTNKGVEFINSHHFPRPNISKTNRLKLCSGHSVEAPNLALFQPLGWKRWKGVIQEELKPNNTYICCTPKQIFWTKHLIYFSTWKSVTWRNLFTFLMWKISPHMAGFFLHKHHVTNIRYEYKCFLFSTFI